MKIKLKSFVRNNSVYIALANTLAFAKWARKKYRAPSPHFIKQACLLRNGFENAIWVETGTYLGETTRVLAKHSSMVYTIEPEPRLFANAVKYFKNHKNVRVLNGTSEQIFPTLLKEIQGNVNFWLDGHYSAGITFKGENDTPILEELKHISENLKQFRNICVLIDDIRCFNPKHPEYANYPNLDSLVNWASSNDLEWHIEHDIFVARSTANISACQ